VSVEEVIDLSTENLLPSARVAIVGMGLMGGSLAMALRGKCAMLLGCDSDQHVVHLALAQNVVDHASTNAAKILPMADLVILAAPVKDILHLLRDMDRLHPGPAMVLDLGSTKRQVLAAMELLPVRFDPIGGHPICGKEKSSLTHAEPGLYQGAPFVLCRLPRTSDRVIQLSTRLVQAVGAHPVWLDAHEHDRWIAVTSHLPYLLANALIQATPVDAAAMIGPGFRSVTRLAGSFAPMMLDVLETNQDSVLSALHEFREMLDRLEDCLLKGEETEIKEFLITSVHRHEALLKGQLLGSASGEGRS
jgi:prephenate dehydrogenase